MARLHRWPSPWSPWWPSRRTGHAGRPKAPARVEGQGIGKGLHRWPSPWSPWWPSRRTGHAGRPKAPARVEGQGMGKASPLAVAMVAVVAVQAHRPSGKPKAPGKADGKAREGYNRPARAVVAAASAVRPPRIKKPSLKGWAGCPCAARLTTSAHPSEQAGSQCRRVSLGLREEAKGLSFHYREAKSAMTDSSVPRPSAKP